MQTAVDPYSVFLNIPYDKRFQRLYLAYIAGISAFGLDPRATLEIPGGERRLDRIFQLIRTCRYSLHDLSRIQLDRKPPPTPRFNMPFELGLVVALTKMRPADPHVWCVFETVRRRFQKSLSDLDGTEVYIHDGTPEGVFRELCNAFIRTRYQPGVRELEAIYIDLQRATHKVIRETGARSLFEARPFKELVVLARSYARQRIPSLAASNGDSD